MVGEIPVVKNPDDSFTIEVTGSDIVITVTNYRNEIIDTGISLDSLPYILILALATAGLGVGFVRKRNISKED